MEQDQASGRAAQGRRDGRVDRHKADENPRAVDRPARSIAEYNEILERSRGDASRLEALRVELDPYYHDQVYRIIILKVVGALLAARKGVSSPVSRAYGTTPQRGVAATAPRPNEMTAFLNARKLVSSDGRCLHLYKVTDFETSQLRDHLHHFARSGQLNAKSRVTAALFVLFSAEWFRRSFYGGSYSWDGVVSNIGATISPQERSLLVEQGLLWWQRPLRRSSTGNRQFLLSCVLEGGFPTRLLESREHGWLGAHLRRLVSLAMTIGGTDRTEALASHASRDQAVPESFRTDEFRTLCAALACAIVDLRREVQGLSPIAGERASARLDRHRPEWRSDLPLVIEGQGAERLLDDLLNAPVESLGGDEARCWRLLVRAGDGWTPALRLSADGAVALPSSFAPGTSRLRALPVGRLADDLKGEIALIDPPGTAGSWLARARPGAPREPIQGYPLTAPVEVELRCEQQTLGRLQWKGGGPVRGEVLTFFDEGGSGQGEQILALIGIGSCRARHTPLFVLAPPDHTARTRDGLDIAALWTGPLGQLFRLDAVSYVGRRDDDDLFYRIEPGAPSERTQSLGLHGPVVKGLSSLDGDDIYTGPPQVSKIVGNKQSDARSTSREVFWRHQHRADWQDLAQRKIEPGVIELIWRDPQSRAAFDRRRIIVLPADARFDAASVAESRARFALEQAPAWRLTAAESPDISIEQEGLSLCVGWRGTPQRVIVLRLDTPAGSRVAVRANFPFPSGAFVGADGHLMKRDTVVTLDQLRGARAIVGSHGDLRVEPRGGTLRWTQADRFSLEYPLWSVRDLIEALLSESGSLDAEVLLRISPGDTVLRVRRYEFKFTRPDAIVARLERSTADPAGLTYSWRSLIDMTQTGSLDLEPADHAGAGCGLPSDLPGPGVVFGRRGPLLAVRPTFVYRPLLVRGSLTALQTAALVADPTERNAAILARLTEIGEGAADSAPDLAWMQEILAIPERLPPTTFEVIQALAACPGAAVALLMAAPVEALVERVWRLEQALPFLWVLCRVGAWRTAYDSAHRRLFEALAVAGFAPDEAAELAQRKLAFTLEQMVHLDEALVKPLVLAGLSVPPGDPIRSAHDIAQDRIRRSGERQDMLAPSSCFDLASFGTRIAHRLAPWRAVFDNSHRQGLDARSAPDFPRSRPSDFDQSHWQGLEAPLFAALAAASKVIPTAAQRLAMRQARREDPQHFCEAYAAALSVLAQLN